MVIKVETYRFWFVNLWKKIADFPAVWGGRTQQFLLGHWQRFFVIEPLLKKKGYNIQSQFGTWNQYSNWEKRKNSVTEGRALD